MGDRRVAAVDVPDALAHEAGVGQHQIRPVGGPAVPHAQVVQHGAVGEPLRAEADPAHLEVGELLVPSVADLGAPTPIVASLATKSTTAPIAMALSETLGGIPALAAVLVVITGIFGAVVVTPLMNALRVTDFAARGFAVGVASHGIGTARAFQVSEEAGVFAGVAMGLNGALTALVFLLIAL
ncbi:hypothetical protein CNY89_13980 [Amaricoccus sp. HAR-UPW-R2A-40]|nr:hypothetical protein CNY89_13980 [Amaricoccus sp. HAR-UPW-R2A-40]